MGYGGECSLRIFAPIFGPKDLCRRLEIPFDAAYLALTSVVKMTPRSRLQLDSTALEADGNAAARHGSMSSFAPA